MNGQRFGIVFALFMVPFFVTGCYEDGLFSVNNDEESSSEYIGTYDYVPVSSYTASEGRLLAAQCAQCHGTNGYSINEWDGLAGEDDLVEEMLEIKDGEEAPIMQAQAHGYTLTEIQAMAAWLQSQPYNESEDD